MGKPPRLVECVRSGCVPLCCIATTPAVSVPGGIAKSTGDEVPAGGCRPFAGRSLLPRTGELLPRRRDDLLRGEPELLLQFLQGRRGPEGVHADARPVQSGVARPGKRGRLLDRNTRTDRRREHAVLVLLTLQLEQLP